MQDYYEDDWIKILFFGHLFKLSTFFIMYYILTVRKNLPTRIYVIEQINCKNTQFDDVLHFNLVIIVLIVFDLNSILDLCRSAIYLFSVFFIIEVNINNKQYSGFSHFLFPQYNFDISPKIPPYFIILEIDLCLFRF